VADANALDRGVPVPSEPGRPADGAPMPTPPAMPADDKTMSLVGHLSELRTRLVRAILAVLVGTIVGFYFSPAIRDVLIAPLPSDLDLQILGVGDGFFIQLKIAIVAGIILAMPVILYQLWAFISPGLTEGEKKAIRPWIPLAMLFFAIGVAIAYVVLPYAIGFLLSFTGGRLIAAPAAGPYFDFVTTMFLAFGLVLEFPIVLYGLSLAHVVSSAQLRSWRRMAFLVIAIFAAVATPGGDLVSPLVLGGTMYILYELTIVFIRRSGR
jgi:sec-independent protein translocase protein TatC